MANLSEILSFLSKLLTPEQFQDAAYNGLQVDSAVTQVAKVAVAVDCGESVVDRAIAERAQLLIVHHGLLWGAEQPVTERYGRKIRKLLSGGCSLYGAHLPLDAHPAVGNNVLIARHLNLEPVGGFAEIGGKQIGLVAKSQTPRTIEYFTDRARELSGFGPMISLPFGPKEITTVGIVTGSGASRIEEVAALGLDLFFSGEPKQHVYHDCKDLKLNAVFAGHYATETVGVRALGDLLHREFNVEAFFIEEPTGI